VLVNYLVISNIIGVVVFVLLGVFLYLKYLSPKDHPRKLFKGEYLKAAYAISSDNREKLTKILSKIENINKLGIDEHYTLLMYAVKKEASKSVKLLLDNGADPKVLGTDTNDNQFSAIYLAVTLKDITSLKILLDYGISSDHKEESIKILALRQDWKRFGDDYQVPELILESNDYGRKNYYFDISSFTSPFFIFSQKAADILASVLEPRGQFLEVNTPSKRKKFIGYYPTNSLPNCLDMEKSRYREFENGLMIDKCVLVSKNITDEYLFTLKSRESGINVFVTDKFRRLVEDNFLAGFNFSREVEVL